MALLNFPASPAPGATYVQNSVTYQYNAAGYWETLTTSGGGIGTVYAYKGMFDSNPSGVPSAQTDIMHDHNLNLTDGYNIPLWIGSSSSDFKWAFSLHGGSRGAYHGGGTNKNIQVTGGSVDEVTWAANRVTAKLCTAEAPGNMPRYTGSLQILY